MNLKFFKILRIWDQKYFEPKLPEMSIDINHRMVRQALYRTATNSTTIIRDIDTQNLNVLVSEFCEEYKCKTYEVPDIVLVFNKILWVNWATSGRFQTYTNKMMRIGIILKDILRMISDL